MKIKQIYDENNHRIQQTSYTCGPATILNVLLLMGNNDYTEEELAQLCETKPHGGTSNDNMIKVIRHVGLKIAEYKSDASIEDIKRNLDEDRLVIVNYFDPFSNEGHYSVITEYDEEALYLRDCWFGLLRLSVEGFEPVWHNSNSTIYGWYVALDK